MKVTSSKLNKKSKSNNKLLKNGCYNEFLFPTPNVDDQLSMQERFNNLENEFKTRFEELDQNLKTILKTLNNLNSDV